MNDLLAEQGVQARTAGRRSPASPSPAGQAAWAIWALALLGGVARFATAARTPLWNDEAHTFRRVSGTFAQLTDILQHDAFPPLHYYAYWALAQALGGAGRLTPFWMRFIPCAAGTLMIPAMYWLTIELCDRRTALLVAAFTACSSFLFAYSHDAKMYMPLWLFCALSMACCLWWMRTGKAVAWCAGAVTSTAMVGLHASGLAVLALQPLVVLTWGRPTLLRVIALALGLAIVTSGPAYYYVSVNHWVKNSEQSGWNRASGLHWVAGFNEGRGGGSRLLYLTSAYLCGWEWPPAHQETDRAAHAVDGIPEWVTPALGTVVAAMLFAALVGGIAGLKTTGSLPQPTSAIVPWRSTLWLGAWLVVPVFVAHRLSSNTSGPSQSEGDGRGLAMAGGLMILAAAGLVLYLAREPLKNLFGKLLGNCPADTRQQLAALGAIVLFAAFIGGVLGIVAGHPDEPSSVWVPRYLGIVWPAFAIVLCSSLLRLPGRALPVASAALLLLVNIAVSAASVSVATEPPVDRMVSDLCTTDAAARVYLPAHPISYPAPGGGTVSNGVGRYYLSIARGNPFGPRGFDEVPITDFVPVRYADDPMTIAADLQANPAIRRVIVWERLPSNVDDNDALLGLLGPDWRRVSDELIPVRYHWNWSKLYVCGRREYLKTRESPRSQAPGP